MTPAETAHLQEKYLERLSARKEPHRTYTPPFGIGFIGLVGSGKSTVAEALRVSLHIPVISTDAMRRLGNSMGYDDTAMESVVEEIALAAMQTMLDNGVSHIVDADAINHIDRLQKLYHDAGFDLYFLAVECPEPEVLARINRRAEDPENTLSRGTHEDYFRRKQLHNEKVPFQADATVDTSIDIQPQIRTIATKILVKHKQIAG